MVKPKYFESRQIVMNFVITYTNDYIFVYKKDQI